ncbi:MAG: UvrD-helicase domain-containing protein [Solirubrobacterales bacterium]|nr:UvrD-helicase domain-containing protein [Solirubrobacterales bacterium]
MPTLAFASEFLEDFAKLQPVVRQKVRELPDKFEHAAQSGVHLEKLTGSRDDRVRTVRVDDFWRGVVVRLGGGNYALLRVMAHDDANAWATRQRFGVNPITGIVEILDVPTVAEQVEAVTQDYRVDQPSDASLFASKRDRDFTSVGVDGDLVPILRRLESEDEVLAIAHLLPQAQADAVLMLADGRSTEEVWSEIQSSYGVAAETEVDPDDIDAALARPASRSAFVVTSTDAELMELLTGDFDAWRTFLHPTQRWLAEKPVFNGPAKVTGGAGTGKTVVLVHRARHLARRLIDAREPTGRVLVATYTRSLAANLDAVLRTFCTPEEFRRLQVSTVDALAHQILSAADVRRYPVRGNELDEVARDSAAMAGLDAFGLDHRFLIAEWEQVVLARDISTLADYVMTARPGRGTRLTRSQRKQVWGAIERLTADLADRKRATYVQIANLAAAQLGRRTTDASVYAHAVIDEAQDLHPAQWRLLRAAVRRGANDLFIAGDAHQRIYDHRVSLSSLGIETRGRSRRLRINYRTSQPILSVAQRILRGEVIDDLDGTAEDSVGYRSEFTGPAPTFERFSTPADEAKDVAALIRTWLEAGVSPSAIGVVGRTRTVLDPVREALRGAGVPWGDLGDGAPKGIRVGTMHSAKGLEFARLAVVGVNADVVPLPFAVTPAGEDPQQHDYDVLRERCLLYVAFTRARDELVVTGSGLPSSLLPSRNLHGPRDTDS